MKAKIFSRFFPPARKVITANSNRCLRAEAAIHEYKRLSCVDLDDALCDLLADLMHWCDEHPFDFDQELHRGRRNYEAEVDE